ncbi:orotate phosphoribosyltransferase [Dolosicoccus paucivorans]|uniref:Orotate phosphoribosyltransferase n=1 Tax=Dolosicoccus paucivorans TaxID=84521 RepID=A0A2N6SM21_9LACT|nr:orotate phosphoribosyltransferase [Dolosicoccus paucivorans]PMB83914.1 orotate phosphoribosyltransferase [Dolosicoccus paucivorans]PMC58121.1 orotate phosphoribosyltransferase [Dolosicoccus paucivorans]
MSSKDIAQILLNIEAVTLKPAAPFTWASGLKSPIYCDNRLIMSYPKERQIIEETLAELIRTEFPDVEVVAGTTTAGIPHAAYVSWLLDLPMIYVRSSSKGHGKQNAIEGELKPGQKVVVIEDLISTGGSVLDAAEKLEEAGAQVIGCAAIFSYLLPQSKEAFAKAGHPLVTLTNYQELVEVALEDDELKDHQETLESWYKDPVAWSKKHQ